jgi:hypothetical protein
VRTTVKTNPSLGVARRQVEKTLETATGKFPLTLQGREVLGGEHKTIVKK